LRDICHRTSSDDYSRDQDHPPVLLREASEPITIWVGTGKALPDCAKIGSNANHLISSSMIEDTAQKQQRRVHQRERTVRAILGPVHELARRAITAASARRLAPGRC